MRQLSNHEKFHLLSVVHFFPTYVLKPLYKEVGKIFTGYNCCLEGFWLWNPNAHLTVKDVVEFICHLVPKLYHYISFSSLLVHQDLKQVIGELLHAEALHLFLEKLRCAEILLKVCQVLWWALSWLFLKNCHNFFEFLSSARFLRQKFLDRIALHKKFLF